MSDLQGRLVVGQGVAEHQQLDRPGEVVQRGEHHRVAVAGADPLGLGDDPPDRHEVLVAALGQRRERAVHPRAHRLAQRFERVGGDEQPDRFLLGREQLGLVELLRGDRRMHRLGQPETRERARGAVGARSPAGGVLLAFLEVEDRALSDEGVLLGLLARRLGLLEHFEHPPAGGTGGAEGAALDERLDRLLVDRAGVHALAEVPQRIELAVLLAGPFDRLHGLVADALDGVQAEADVALHDGELVV